jgi:hypothetical protein
VSTALVVSLIGIAIVVIAVVALTRRGANDDAAAVVVTEAPLVLVDDEGEAVIVPRDPEITWPQLVARDSTRLDDEARLRLINDLALVRAPWCVPILQRASEEERDPANREAALDALAACDPGTVRPTADKL